MVYKSGSDQIIENIEWPQADLSNPSNNKVIIVVQINGKKKGTIKVDENTKKDRVIETIIGSQNNYSINLKKAKKIIFVSNKIINFLICKLKYFLQFLLFSFSLLVLISLCT